MDIIQAVKATADAGWTAPENKLTLVQFLTRYAARNVSTSNYRCLTENAPVLKVFLAALGFVEGTDVKFETSALAGSVTTVVWIPAGADKLNQFREAIADKPHVRIYDAVMNGAESPFAECTGETIKLTDDHWGVRYLQTTARVSDAGLPGSNETALSLARLEEEVCRIEGELSDPEYPDRPRYFTSRFGEFGYFRGICRFLNPDEDSLACLSLLTEVPPRIILDKDSDNNPLYRYFTIYRAEAEEMLRHAPDTKNAIVSTVGIFNAAAEGAMDLLANPCRLWRYIENIYNVVYKGLHAKILPGSRISILNTSIPSGAPVRFNSAYVDDETTDIYDDLDELTQTIIVYAVVGISPEPRTFANIIEMADHVLADLGMSTECSEEKYREYMEREAYLDDHLGTNTIAEQWFARTHLDPAEKFFATRDLQQLRDVPIETRPPDEMHYATSSLGLDLRRSSIPFTETFSDISDAMLRDITSVDTNPCLESSTQNVQPLPVTFTIGACHIFTSRLDASPESYIFRKDAQGQDLDANRIVTNVYSGIRLSEGSDDDPFTVLTSDSSSHAKVTQACRLLKDEPRRMLHTPVGVTDKSGYAGVVVLETNINYEKLAALMKTDGSIQSTATSAFARTIIQGSHDAVAGYLAGSSRGFDDWSRVVEQMNAECRPETSWMSVVADVPDCFASCDAWFGSTVTKNPHQHVRLLVHKDEWGRAIIVYSVHPELVNAALAQFRYWNKIPVVSRDVKEMVMKSMRQAALGDPEHLIERSTGSMITPMYLKALSCLMYRMCMLDARAATIARWKAENDPRAVCLSLISPEPTIAGLYGSRFGYVSTLSDESYFEKDAFILHSHPMLSQSVLLR